MMQLDIKALGIELAAVVKAQMAPLQNKIAALEGEVSSLRKQLEEIPAPVNGKDGADGAPGRDGVDCDMEAVKAMLVDMVKSIPAPVNGKDGADGKDGATGAPGEKGADGKDGAGIADLMIDRAGELIATFTDGRMKNLGQVIGKDGRDGIDGKDGIGLDLFELEYLDETHEIRIKAACAGRVKEIKFPAGGIRPAGYWREGTKAKAGEAWTQDGSTYVAKCDTQSKPDAKGDWVLLARKGRDGETIVKTVSNEPPKPIKLKGDDK